MQNRPLISIVVPAHNSARFVGQTLASICSQSLEDWECVVVDDGSKDETCDVVNDVCRADRRVRLIRQSCGGSSLARNRGFWESHAASQYVSFMDADDVWEPDALSTLVERISSHSESVGAHGIADFVDSDGQPLHPGGFSEFGRRRLGYRNGAIREWPLDLPTVFETLVWTGPLYPPGLLLARRTAYERAGLFDPDLKHCEDWDMCLRLTRLGPIEFINKVLLSYRRHQANQSNNQKESAAMVRRVHRKTFFSSENTPEQREMLRLGWKAWQCYKVREKWRDARRARVRDLPASFFKAVFGFPVHLVRYLRGYPSVSVF